MPLSRAIVRNVSPNTPWVTRMLLMASTIAPVRVYGSISRGIAPSQHRRPAAGSGSPQPWLPRPWVSARVGPPHTSRGRHADRRGCTGAHLRGPQTRRCACTDRSTEALRHPSTVGRHPGPALHSRGSPGHGCLLALDHPTRAERDMLIDVEALERTFVVRRRTGGVRRRVQTVVRAVSDLTFGIDAGEMVGYIGPNGAGKSTTIKMLTGILVPTSGRLRVAGLEPSRQRTELARRIGVVFGQRTTLWWDLPLRDSFALLQRLYRVEPARHRRNLAEYVELLDLGDLLDVPV